MSEVKYSIGIDFGTLSGRAILADISSGAIAEHQSPRGKAQTTCKDFMFYLFIGCATWHVDLSSLT